MSLSQGFFWRVYGFALHKDGGPAKCMQTGGHNRTVGGRCRSALSMQISAVVTTHFLTVTRCYRTHSVLVITETQFLLLIALDFKKQFLFELYSKLWKVVSHTSVNYFATKHWNKRWNVKCKQCFCIVLVTNYLIQTHNRKSPPTSWSCLMVICSVTDIIWRTLICLILE